MQNQMIVSLIKPSAHLEAANKGEATYQAGQGIFCTCTYYNFFSRSST